MSMGLKLFNVVGTGFVAGEVIDASNDTLYLKFPGVLKAFQTPQGTGLHIVDIVPEFLDNFRELVERMPLPRGLILMTGGMKPEMENIYGEFVKTLIQRLTGIHLVGADAMGGLPKDGKTGEPIVK